MKNYIKLSIIALSAVGLTTSCDMDAPSTSSTTPENIYSSAELAEPAVMAINQSFAETNSYRGRYIPYYGIGTDVDTGSGTTVSLEKATDSKVSLMNYNTLPDNSQMNNDNNVYAKLYEAIERANIAIKYIAEVGNIENNKNLAHLYGEALTLRAVIYLDLVKAFGDVPARFEPLNNANKYKPRESKDSIFKRLLSDLAIAEQYCYWPNQKGEYDATYTSSTERVSKSFAKALRARVALYACGYNLYGDGYRRSNDPELSQDKMMAIVKQECEEVINSGRNHLGTFKENFTKLCNDDVTAGGESLWEIPFSDGRGRVAYTFAVEHKAKDQYTGQPKGGQNGPMPYLFYDFDKDDVRRDITCVPYEWGDKLVDGNASQQLRSLDSWCFGKIRYEWMKRKVTSTNDDGINWQYMRLADVYLMAAEAENYLNGPAAGWTYMKPVLDRALPATKVAALQAKYTASKDAFLNGIMEQRAFEFAGESLRKADLIRWGVIDQKMAEAKQKLTDLANRQGAYADLPEKLYYKLETDGETLKIYGLEHGDTDEEGSRLTKEEGYESKGWFVSNGLNTLEDDYINGLYINQPSLNCLWPIWKTFIDNSNGMLNNDGNYGQLSK